MYKLPYIRVPAEFLIPHPGASYTLPIAKEHTLNTNRIILNNIQYEDAFIIIPFSPTEKIKYCSLAIVEDIFSSKTEKLLIFSVVHKLYNYTLNKKLIYFELPAPKKFTSFEESQLQIISTYLKLDSFFNSSISVPELEEDNALYFLDQIAAQLNFPLSLNIKYYNLKRHESKINIIYSNIINSILSNNALPNEKKIKFPQLVLEKFNFETNRLDSMSPASVDYSNTLDYLDFLQKIPWNEYVSFNSDIEEISQTLNKNHHGLPEVKNQILEYFYLEKLTSYQDGGLFLFNGPPGTGKTSIAKAIAKATNRDFIFISLGGVSDESEIRGHRRTYAGSKPGRIITALTKCKSMNPIILLDEIDKTGISTSKGNVQAALLEILDKQQNDQFVDRYIEVPVDLSKAMIICTSNNIKDISQPLLNRLSLINFTDYTYEEKVIIINLYIFPKIVNQYLLIDHNITIENNLVEHLAKKFSLREIETIIARLLRNKSKHIVLSFPPSLSITLKDYTNLYKVKSNSRSIGFVNNFNRSKQNSTLS